MQRIREKRMEIATLLPIRHWEMFFKATLDSSWAMLKGYKKADVKSQIKLVLSGQMFLLLYVLKGK
jgi:hypothetical protein